MQGVALFNLIGVMQSLSLDLQRTQGSYSFLAKEPPWDALGLKRLLQQRLLNQQVIVVSNREPYVHHRTENRVQVTQPPGGLVTALEPVLRACGGTWIAHGGGNADAEFVNARSTCRVPPGIGDYTLRRVWLNEVEQACYLDGFSNEGLWPLCHLTNQTAVFRNQDWQAYQRVNSRFADAVVQEARQEDPVVLVQDYQLALVPQLIRARLPLATVMTFWHIPWPSPTIFGACPWQHELLTGILGSSIVGFQTEVDRRNFLTCVHQKTRKPVNWEESSVEHNHHLSLVRTYPISIDWPDQKAEKRTVKRSRNLDGDGRNEFNERWPLPKGGKLLVGVDRFDYTKGFLERMRALEHLLAAHPDWVGKISLVQVAAPTRGAVSAYAEFQAKVLAEVDRINDRFKTVGSASNYRPIYLLNTHHDHAEVNKLYRGADVCVVSSLHDGMNLVAKEFVAAREDESGVLVLSKFAGAAAELSEAILINPHNIEQTANALLRAITMPVPEQKSRMRDMRSTVRHANIYLWAASILKDIARIRDHDASVAKGVTTYSAESVACQNTQSVVA